MIASLDGASVVVLGGSSGMGLATAKGAATHGAKVTIVARGPDRLKEAEREIGGDVRTEALDAADAGAVAAMFERVGHVDHVVSFTGEQPSGKVGDTDHATYQRAMDARVWAARNACAAAAPRMDEAGTFTFCSGVSAVRARADRFAGAVATGALESFVRAMAVELAPIRVNALRPGAIDTGVLDRAFGDRRQEMMRPFLEQLPLGRIGRPEEIADAALFLMCNGYVTGTVLGIDGGALRI